MVSTDSKYYDTILYTPKGICEICRWSRKPKADAFMDWVWDIIEAIRTGELKITSKSEIRKLEAEAKLLNARTRQAHILINADRGFKKLLPKETKNTMVCSATKLATGKNF